jgi:hypothetical protein
MRIPEENMKLRLILYFTVAILTACKEASFHGENSVCANKPDYTKATLVTKEFRNGQSPQTFEYSISLADCKGKTRSLNETVVLFDMRAGVSNFGKSLTYKILKDSSVLSEGVLESVIGRDLFGVEGQNRGHHRTSNLKFGVPVESFLLSIDVSGVRVMPEGTQTDPIPNFMMDTYLRLGNAEPVTQPIPVVN